MVWWITSWADDDEWYKEEQPREGLFLVGAMNWKEEFNRPLLSLSVAYASLTDFLGCWILDSRCRYPGGG